MSRFTYFLLFVFFAFFAFKFFETSLRDYNIKINGKLTLAEVKSNAICGRSGGTIKVLIDEGIFNLGIGSNDCRNGTYNIGDKLNVLYGSQYNYIILPNKEVKTGLFMSVAFFLLPLFCLYRIVKN